MASGSATSAHDLAENLASRLDIEIEDGTDAGAAMREGIETVIREALRNEDPDGRPARAPVLGHLAANSHGYWRRIPGVRRTWRTWRFMADYRQRQAGELQAAADELSDLAHCLEKIAADQLPGETRLTALWEPWVEKHGRMARAAAAGERHAAGTRSAPLTRKCQHRER